MKALEINEIPKESRRYYIIMGINFILSIILAGILK